MVVHALSFDVEEWFDGNLVRDRVPVPPPEGRWLERAWHQLLDDLAAAGVQATFFILGRRAQELPHLVRATAAAGHEVASHGYDHLLANRRSPGDLLADLRRARGLLQDLSGQPVDGFRSPSWSLTRADTAALAAVAAAGHRYSSSVFPLRTPLYGDGTAPTAPFWHRLPGGRSLLELPPAVLRVGRLGLPFGGGVYWRILPGWVVRWLLATSPAPRMTYLHPWELIPEPLPLPSGLPLLVRLALTWGTGGARRRLRRLLAQVPFAPVRRAFGPWIESCPSPEG